MLASLRPGVFRVCACGALALAGAQTARAQTLSDSIAARLRERMASQPAPAQRFYEGRDFRAAWSGNEGLLPRASEAAAVIHDAGRDGLRASDYAPPALRFLLDADSLAELDLRLTRAALAYAADLVNGRVDPPRVDTLWSAAAAHRIDLPAWLAAGVEGDSVGPVLESLAPPQGGYAALRAVLARYRDIVARGGWARLPRAALAPGDRGPVVAALRARLAVEGDLGAARADGDAFDATLQAALQQFQRRHGLDADGMAGPATLAALNVPAAERVRQIELNLERWRWLPRALGARYVVVNSAAFELEAVQGGSSVMTMRAIVGRPDWPTPIVGGRITGVLFGPVWNIPRAIAVQEVLPQAQGDSGYLRREGIHVFRDSAGPVEIDPATVDWSQVSETTFAFQLRQEPGRANPLGGVKFVSANRFDAYIHDTPVRALFGQRVRTFSHGCVRVERAAELAELLLHDPSRWPLDSIRAAMARPEERWVALAEAVPVYLGYWTAWVEADGTVEFRDDVYEWDARLAEALAARR